MRTYLYISYKCNCNCFFCASDETNEVKENNEVSFEDAKRFMLSSPNKNKLIISGGEPTIHKDFLKIVQFANQHYEHITLMTNGIRFADRKFLEATIDAGVDKISIPFYSMDESEHNNWVGNPNAFKELIKAFSHVNSLLSEKKIEVQIKLLLAKFTYKLIPNSIEYFAINFPNIKQMSLNGFHIGEKALQHKDQCIIDYNESRQYNDITIQTLNKYNYFFQVCDIPICAFSVETAKLLLKHNRIVCVDDAFLKRPDRNTKIVSSSVYIPKECEICSLSNRCFKIYGKNASLFNYGIRPITI